MKWLLVPLIIAITEDGVIIYIDRAYAVHADMRRHSGLIATMDKGTMISVSKKLGLVTLSSTVPEMQLVQILLFGPRRRQCQGYTNVE